MTGPAGTARLSAWDVDNSESRIGFTAAKVVETVTRMILSADAEAELIRALCRLEDILNCRNQLRIAVRGDLDEDQGHTLFRTPASVFAL
jgi:hypothetical protein